MPRPSSPMPFCSPLLCLPNLQPARPPHSHHHAATAHATCSRVRTWLLPPQSNPITCLLSPTTAPSSSIEATCAVLCLPTLDDLSIPALSSVKLSHLCPLPPQSGGALSRLHGPSLVQARIFSPCHLWEWTDHPSPTYPSHFSVRYLHLHAFCPKGGLAFCA